MPEPNEGACNLIQSPLQQLDAEANSLERALASLGEGSPAKPPRRRPRNAAASRKAARKRKSARAPHGQRREQFLAALAKSPGAKASGIAKELGISANQAPRPCPPPVSPKGDPQGRQGLSLNRQSRRLNEP